MLCGGPHICLQGVFAERMFGEGNHSTPDPFVIKKAFAER
jgi:hypothetical protein